MILKLQGKGIDKKKDATEFWQEIVGRQMQHKRAPFDSSKKIPVQQFLEKERYSKLTNYREQHQITSR